MQRILLIVPKTGRVVAILADTKAELKSACLELKKLISLIRPISKEVADAVETAPDETDIVRAITLFQGSPEGRIELVTVIDPPKSPAVDAKAAAPAPAKPS